MGAVVLASISLLSWNCFCCSAENANERLELLSYAGLARFLLTETSVMILELVWCLKTESIK